MSDKQDKPDQLQEQLPDQNQLHDQDYLPQGQQQSPQNNQPSSSEVQNPYSQIHIIPPSPHMQQQLEPDFQQVNQIPYLEPQLQIPNTIHNQQQDITKQKEYELRLSIINSYQNRLFNLQQKLGSIKASEKELKEQNGEYRIQLDKEVNEKIEAHYRIKQLEAEVQHISNYRDQLTEQNKYYEERLKSYASQESVEDVKKKLEIANNMNQLLNVEIRTLEATRSLMEKNYPSPDLTYFNTFEEQNRRIDALSIDILEAERRLKEKQEERDSIYQTLQSAQIHINQNQQIISEKIHNITLLETTITSLQTQNKKLQDSYIKVQSLLSKLQSQSHIHSSDYQSQKEQIQKDYLSLQQKYHILRQHYQHSQKQRTKLKETLSQLKLSSIPKQQYDSLSRRYVQAKKRLESSFNLSGQLSLERIVVSEDQPVYDLKNKLVQEESKQLEILRRLESGFGGSKVSQHEVNELKKDMEKVRMECEGFRYSAEHYKKELEENRLLLSESRLKYIQLANKVREESERFYQTQTENIDLANNNKILRLKLDTNQSKVLSMTNTIISLQKISLNYKISYQSLKTQLHQASLLIGSQNPTTQTLQSQTLPELSFKIIEIPSERPTISQSTQTPSFQNVSKLKRINQSFESFPSRLNVLLNELDTVNKRGNELNQRYNMKFKNLTIEKQENDSWRGKVREEVMVAVRKEFNEIKEIVEDERLLNALQKAKYLIDEYSKEYDEGQADQGQGEQGQTDPAQEPLPQIQQENENQNNEEVDPTLQL